MSFSDIVRSGLTAWELPADEKPLARLEGFCARLLETNRVMNLTAVTDPDAVAVRHMLDSLFLLTAADFSGKRVIDVGTGAGFPGLPLKLYRPELDVTLLDSTRKRIDFVARTAEELGCPVRAVAARAEELIAQKGEREGYDIAVSRAVAPLNILAELCLPFIRPGGLFLPSKSANDAFREELEQGRGAVAALGGAVRDIIEYTLPGEEGRRCVLVIEKQRPTPAQYPRRYAKIAAAPLR